MTHFEKLTADLTEMSKELINEVFNSDLREMSDHLVSHRYMIELIAFSHEIDGRQSIVMMITTFDHYVCNHSEIASATVKERKCYLVESLQDAHRRIFEYLNDTADTSV